MQALIRYFRILAPLLSLAFGTFILGVAFHKYRFFPYELMKEAVDDLKRRYTDSNEVLEIQYSRDAANVPQGRRLDTALLPLRIQGIRISEHFSVPKVGGSITTVGDVIVIVDRLGNIYSCGSHGEGLKKLPFPELPNNIIDYLSQPDAVVDDKKFRAYSVKYLDFAKSLAVSHEYFDTQQKKTRLAISVIAIDEKTIEPRGAWQTIFLGDLEPQGPNEQAGGHLAARRPDKIFLSIGDYLITDPMVSQDPSVRMGKILEIDINTRVVKTVSIGHRNPEGLIVTSGGKLLSTEHGPAGGDELNSIVEGANYGWPIVTLGTEYHSYRWRDSKAVGAHNGYQEPMFAWIPSIGISSLLEIQGLDQRWNFDLLVGSLKGQSLFRLRLDTDKVLYDEPIWVGQRIRDLAQTRNGTIVLWTDDTELLFVTVDRQRLETDQRNPKSTSGTLAGNCMYCHHFGPTGPSDFAPSLTNVIGRKIGSDNYRYSTALRTKDGVWSEKALRTFIANPDAFATGTAMPNLHLSDDQIDEVIHDIQDNSTIPASVQR